MKPFERMTQAELRRLHESHRKLLYGWEICGVYVCIYILGVLTVLIVERCQ